MASLRDARRSTVASATGFTVLELLVVMGIMAVIFTLLATTIGRIYDRAKVITCASNERGIYLACLNYANDNDNMLPCPSLEGSLRFCMTAINPMTAPMMPKVGE